ncbi:hypothetical protein CC78DRAFT_330618 [Lojkania enalia]|uniref:Fucose-specific lectin n=1 Tax=Lojkania enalia TaxID=147567 RepID=A0A9P4KJT9_9PLEO|nr:hypothetical protein CC78DRAFT_330618 [Didymosphaeria enalia]
MPTPETPPEARAVAESNGVNYYVLQDPNSTKIWSRIYENGWGRPEIVGEARESTPAAYVVYNQNSTKRAIFSLDSVSMLQTHEFDDEFADWEVGSKISAAHPQTSIAAVYDGQMLRVYYQDPEGNLRESVSGGYMEPWKPAEKPLPDVKVVPGTGLSATIIGGRVSLFYGNQDFSIHQLLYDNNDWTVVRHT